MNTKNKRSAALLIGAGALSSLTLALSFNPAMAAFVASITNSTNTTGLGTLTMQEKNADGSIVCNSTDGANNAATCATINKYGGAVNAKPGDTSTTNISITNTGTVAASSFTLSAGACTQGGTATATDFCSQLSVTVVANGTQVYSGPASGLTTVSLPAPVAPGAVVPITITTTTPATLSNAYQGATASQPLTWTFTA